MNQFRPAYFLSLSDAWLQESDNDNEEQNVKKRKQVDGEIVHLNNYIADDQQIPDGIDVAPVDRMTGCGIDCCGRIMARRPKVGSRTKLTWLDVMKSPTMVLYTFIMCSLWSVLMSYALL